MVFSTLACERIFIKTDITESRYATGPENILFLRRVLGSFSPEILQAGAMKVFFVFFVYANLCPLMTRSCKGYQSNFVDTVPQRMWKSEFTSVMPWPARRITENEQSVGGSSWFLISLWVLIVNSTVLL